MQTNNEKMILGAICGDTVGSNYEWHSTKDKNFRLENPRTRFTDDTVMTVAIMAWLLGDYPTPVEAMQTLGRRYSRAGYGGGFRKWIDSPTPQPYNSFGNGSAMRVSGCGWLFDTEEETLAKAKESAEVTHNHPEGIKGAQATALAIFMARTGKSKEDIKARITELFGYDLDRKLDDIRPGYSFNRDTVSCQGSVPEAIISFLESTSYEDAIRNAISLGGDADTQGAIAGSIAEAFYGGLGSDVLYDIVDRHLTTDLKEIVFRFSRKVFGKEEA